MSVQPTAAGAPSPSSPTSPLPAPTTAGTTPLPRLGLNYWRLLLASAVTNLGDGLMSVAVVWLASSLTRDPVLIALVGLASRLPWLLFSLPAGVITDRYDRRLLVVWMDLARFCVITAFAVLILLAHGDLPTPESLAAGATPPSNAPVLLASLCLMALLLGFAEVVRDNSAQTLLPSVVDKRLLERANGRMWGAETAMNNFVGPPLAGLLIALAVAIPFFVNAGLLATGATLVFALTGSFKPKGRAGTGRIAWRAEIAEGFRWLWDHRVLRALALLLGAMNMASAMAFVIFVLFAQEILGLFSGWQFGLVLTGSAAGAILGSLLGDRIAAALGDGRSLMLSIVAVAGSFTVIGLVSSAVLVWLVSLLSGVAIVLWNVITVSLRQRIIPDHLLGRVNSVYRFFGWGTISLGTLLGGLIVTWGEPLVGREGALRAPFLIAGAVHLLLLAYAARRVGTAQLDAARAEAPRD